MLNFMDEDEADNIIEDALTMTQEEYRLKVLYCICTCVWSTRSSVVFGATRIECSEVYNVSRSFVQLDVLDVPRYEYTPVTG